jgi:hypothetical protein
VPAKPPIDLSEVQPIDLSDIAGLAPPSVADKARASLRAKGLSPEDVKAGKGLSSSKASMGDNIGALLAGLGGMVGDVGASIPGAGESLFNLATAPPRLAAKAASTINGGGGILDALNSGYNLPPTSTFLQQNGNAAANDIKDRLEHFLHVDPTKDTEAASYIGRTVPQVALAGTGLVKGMAKAPVSSPTQEPSFSVDSEGPSYAPDVLGDNVNKALGTGFDIKTGKNAGKAAAILKAEIEHKMVSKDPMLLHKHIQSEMDHANLAGDQLLSSPDATAPSVSGIKILENATGRQPLLSPAEAKQWNFIVDYLKNDLEAKAQLKGGLNSIKDIDSVKRLVQDRTNFDKLFSASDTVRNELLGRLGRGFDKVGDTLPGYRDLNDYRSNLIHLREQVAPIVEKAKNGVAAPSKIKAIVKGAKGLTPFGNASDLIKAGVDLSESSMTPVKIAKEINKAITQGRINGLINPASRILSTVDKAMPFPLDHPNEMQIPPQFAAGESGEALPLGKFRPDDVAASHMAPADFDPEAAMLHSSFLQSEAQPSSFNMPPQFGTDTSGGAMPIGARGAEDVQASFDPHGPGVFDFSTPPSIREMLERQAKAANPIGKAHSQLVSAPKLTQSPIEAATKARSPKVAMLKAEPSAPPIEGLPPYRPRSSFASDEEFSNYQLARQKAILASYK